MTSSRIMSEQEILKAWELVKNAPGSAEAMDALSEIVTCNDGLICMLIKKHYPTYIKNHMEDMMQEGRMAIYEHFASFNPSKGRFSTFITTYILHSISSYLGSLNGCTPHYFSNLKKYNKAVDTLQREGINNPTIAQIADKMGVGKEAASTIYAMKNRLTGTLSIDESGNSLFYSADMMQSNPMEILEDKDLYYRLMAAMKDLPQAEYDVIYEIYLNGNDGPKALRLVAENLGMKIDDVRRLKASAYRKLYNNKSLRSSTEDYNRTMSDFVDSISIEFSPSSALMENDVDTILAFDF